jgi:streptogramin lyase
MRYPIVLGLLVAFLAGCSSHAAPVLRSIAAAPQVVQRQPHEMGWATADVAHAGFSPTTNGKQVYWIDDFPHLGSVTMDLKVSLRNFGPGVSDAYSLAYGPDGNFWAGGFGFIARLVSGGSETDFTVPGGGLVRGIVSGPDGALWFTVCPGPPTCEVGRITTTGSITLYPVGGSQLKQITNGSDGNLWVADSGEIHRVTTSGVDTDYPINIAATDISSGPDGALYFAGGDSMFGRITTDGVVSYISAPSSDNSYVWHLTLGPGGALWLALNNAFRAGEPNGIQVYYPLTNSFGQFIEVPILKGTEPVISGITGGPDHNIWVTGSGHVMAYLRLAMSVTPSTLTLSAGTMGALTVSEKTFKGSWGATSSSKAVATVVQSPAGTFTVTGVAAGSCKITIKDGDGNFVVVPVTVQ